MQLLGTSWSRGQCIMEWLDVLIRMWHRIWITWSLTAYLQVWEAYWSCRELLANTRSGRTSGLFICPLHSIIRTSRPSISRAWPTNVISRYHAIPMQGHMGREVPHRDRASRQQLHTWILPCFQPASLWFALYITLTYLHCCLLHKRESGGL